MSLQTIIDNATFITFDHKKIAAQAISRSGRLTTAELASAVPFYFTVGMHQALQFSTNRDLLAEIDVLDVTEESIINIGTTNTGLKYITQYRGDLASVQQGQVRTHTTTPYNGKELYLDCSGVSGASGNLLLKGDIIQPGIGGASSYRYPYIVTADVPFSTSANITVPVHRTVIPQDGFTLTNKSVRFGEDCDWRVKMVNKPNYTIVPHDRIRFGSDFELVEVVRKEDG